MSLSSAVNNVVSFSGGKDSTAMALVMLEKDIPIHSVVAFDTGWEFPQMLEHWDKFERVTGLKINRINPVKSFDYWMFDHKIHRRFGTEKGTLYGVGYGWPSPSRRWCTREKMVSIRRYLKPIPNAVSCVGFAADEIDRVGSFNGLNIVQRHPLIELGIDEAQALTICKQHGFDWGGLYDHFNRVSCYNCPLQRIGDLKILRANFSDLWSHMLDCDSRMPDHNPGFRGKISLSQLDARFLEEDRQFSFDQIDGVSL